MTEGEDRHNEATTASKRKQGIRLFSRSKEKEGGEHNRSQNKLTAPLSDRLFTNHETVASHKLTCCPSSNESVAADLMEIGSNIKIPRTKSGTKIKPVKQLFCKTFKPVRLNRRQDTSRIRICCWFLITLCYWPARLHCLNIMWTCCRLGNICWGYPVHAEHGFFAKSLPSSWSSWMLEHFWCRSYINVKSAYRTFGSQPTWTQAALKGCSDCRAQRQAEVSSNENSRRECQSRWIGQPK